MSSSYSAKIILQTPFPTNTVIRVWSGFIVNTESCNVNVFYKIVVVAIDYILDGSYDDLNIKLRFILLQWHSFYSFSLLSLIGNLF